jgi:hypothetical protein
MKRCVHSLLAATLLVALAPNGWGQATGFFPKGTLVKYSQPIRHVIDPGWPDDMMNWGEDIASDVDWNKIMQSATIEPNWIIADDFQDQFNLPVRTVKWWGSYLGPVFQQTATGVITLPPGPGVEDGYVISFFGDVPVGPDNPFSHPDGLLGTYVVPFDKVSVKPTPFVGWDMHPIWEYEANLMDAHLDHAVSPFADQMGFNQRAGEIYWISIVAEVGHALQTIVDPTSGEVRWISEDTGKFAQQHYWGWHTSPVHFNDVATMGHLFMPGNNWEYFDWMRIQPQHGLFDMAFQLKTIPEPTTFAIAALAWLPWMLLRRQCG